MSNAEKIDGLLSKLFLHLEVSDLDRSRCVTFLQRAGWDALAALESADQIRSHLSISRGPSLKLEAALALNRLAPVSPSRPTWTVELICEDLKQLSHEELRGIYWDSNENIVHAQTLAIGTIDSVELSPYAVLRPAFLTESRRITLAHNHPSDNHEHSITDIASMSRLSAIASSVGITIDPLVIVAK